MSREDWTGNSDPQAAADPIDLATATGASIIRDGLLLTLIGAVKAAGGDLSAMRQAVVDKDGPALIRAINDALASLRPKPQQVISEPVYPHLSVPPIISSDNHSNRSADVETKPGLGWLKVGFVWAIVAVAIFVAHHHFIKVPAQKRAEDKARIAVLERKISSNFDNYLKAAPLLKGDTAEVFARTVDSKIYALGYSPHDPRYQGMTPPQRWRAVTADRKVASARMKAERAKHEAIGLSLVSENMENCRASFSEDCNDMIQLWLCVSGKHCTAMASEWLQEYVEEVVEISDPEYGYCVNRTEQCGS